MHNDELLVPEHFTVSVDVFIKPQLLELLAMKSRTLNSAPCCTSTA